MPTRSISRPRAKDLHDLAAYFYALKDGLRLEMLQVLAARELTVNDLAEAVNKSQPLISWHLRRLKAAGIVKIRRSGREVYCSLDRAVLLERQRAFLELIDAA